jgi:hypothetical protein
MDKLKKIYEYQGEVVYGFCCPACKDTHQVRLEGPYAWQWNGSLDRPTIQPSILSNVGGANPTVPICHSYVTDGRIQYLGDCSHDMKGQTVELPDWSDEF